MSYLSLVYGGGVVLSSAAAIGAAFLGNAVNPISLPDGQITTTIYPKQENSITSTFEGGEKTKLVLEILKHNSSENFDYMVSDIKEEKYPGQKLLKKMDRVGLGIKDLAKCSDAQRLVCGLLVRKVTDMINRTSNPSKFIGMGDQTQEATELIRNTQSKKD
jgi:hypothetical protein